MTDCGGRTANYEKLSTSSFGKPVSQSDIQSSVQEMLAHLKMVHMELDMVADMEVDKVADIDINIEIQFGEMVGQRVG